MGGKYKILVVDDNKQRKAIYKALFVDETLERDTFDLFFVSESFNEFLETKSKHNCHCFVIDMNLVWEGTPQNNFEKVLKSIGSDKPIVLLSEQFDNTADWLTPEFLKYQIIHIINWKKVKEDKEVRANHRTNIVFELDRIYSYSKMEKSNNDSIKIFHLSDLQFDLEDKSKIDKSKIFKEQLIGFISNTHPDIDFFAITGDITEHALPSEFEIAKKWIEELTTGYDKDRILLVNGNHDYNLSIGALNDFEFDFGSQPINMIKRKKQIADYQQIAFYPYKAFIEEITGDRYDNLTFYNERFSYLGINFLHLNALESYCPDISNDKNQLFKIETDTFDKINKNNSKLFTIILSHAGIDCLKYKKTLEEHSTWEKLYNTASQHFKNSLLLCGHKHEDSLLKSEPIGKNNKLYHITAPTLLSKPEQIGITRGFNLITLEREFSIVKTINCQRFFFSTQNRIEPHGESQIEIISN